MKKIALLLALVLCVGVACPAGALVIEGAAGAGGNIRRGYYYNGKVSFKLPGAAWTQDYSVAYSDFDEINLSGTADVNGFIPGLYIQIEDTPWDMDAEFEEFISGDGVIRTANQTYRLGDDLRAHYDCYLGEEEDGRMGLNYLIWFNCGEYGVVLYYYTFAATRSIPDDLPALDDVVRSFAISE